MGYENLLVETRDGVAIVTVNRPAKLNALDARTIAELDAAFDALGADGGVRGVVLTGAGENAFVAGADIEELSRLGPEEGRALAQRGQVNGFGLVNRVVPRERLLAEAETLVRKMAANGPLALRATLEAVTEGLERALPDGLEREAALFGELVGTEDAREGTRAFLERRPAQFKGR